MKKNLLLLLFIIGWAASAFSQNDEKEGPRNFGANKLLITGNGEAKFFADSGNVNFGDVNFKPIFLWKLSDKLFVESEVEIETGDGFADVGLEYVNMCYMINPHLLIHGGRFLPQFGMYRGRLGEAFINRFATDPVGFGDGGIGPMDEVGIGAQGSAQTGNAKINYSVWISDGPQLFSGGNEGEPPGQFEYEAYTDNNKNKAIGGRIGFLPFSNSSMEIGFSDEWADKTGEQWSDLMNVSVNMLAVDANFFHKVTPLQSTVRLLGEWKSQNVSDAFYPDIEDSIINNNSSAWYICGSIRPSYVDNAFLRNLELALRYSQFMRPETGWGGYDSNQFAASLVYWLKWNCVFKVMWQQQTDKSNVPDVDVTNKASEFVAQIVFGF